MRATRNSTSASSTCNCRCANSLRGPPVTDHRQQKPDWRPEGPACGTLHLQAKANQRGASVP